ncbi:hypothetical protein NQ317_018745 [Molorchus minor]|uniref:Uncharacterized protein n=1 Tax=Molorchus minor TaxID=1323400 RepID=A0ABQ9JFM4_9CUCU|nr:hypothetical protein NQ317_018745 [Molorchus minor]
MMAQSATQTSSICPAASASRLQPPGAMGRPSGIQQPSGMSRLQPPSAGRPSAIAGPSRPSGLQPPRTIGRPGGIPGPSGRPSGLQPPKPCGAVKPPCPGTTVPADIVSAEAEASQKIAEKQLRKPGKRVIAKAIVTRLPVDPGTIDTPEGPQPVVMQTTLEQRVERDETGEKVTKNLGITNVDVCTGVHKKISMGIQQMKTNTIYDIIDQHALKPPISKFELIAANGFRKPHSAFLRRKTNEIIFTSKPWSPQI